MKLQNAKITILIGSDSTIIELFDETSKLLFARVKLTPENLSKALSRLSYTPCEIDINGIDKIGKTMTHKKHQFEVPDEIDYNKKTEILSELIKKTLPDGWVSDNYFSSQDTFFRKDGKNYAQTTIRQWI